MRTAKSSVMCLLVVAMGIVPAAKAESPSVLLQKGLYAEEIEGDLDSAIEIYQKVVTEAKEFEQAAGQAVYRIGVCYAKKGEQAKAGEYFGKVISEHSKQGGLVAKAREQLAKLGISQAGSADLIGDKGDLYEQLPLEVVRFIGYKYGSICAEAGTKSLYCNSHIYYVRSDFVLLKGGMGYRRNSSDQALSSRIRLGGTSNPKQTHYDIGGREMNTEMVPDEVREGFYHIYWTPSEPLPPGQMFYYGWCIEGSKKLLPAPGAGQHRLTMQNQFGDRVLEVFFVVVPTGTEIVSTTEEYTAKDSVGGFDVYSFPKEVPENVNHQVEVILAGPKTVESPGLTEGKANVYEQLPSDVVGHIGRKYGSICAEAGAKELYSNSHIYLVTPDLMLVTGGMGYYHNTSSEAAGGRIHLSGTSDPDQSFYDVAGRKMKTAISGDSLRANFYHIYWTPSEPIPPGQMFRYGWSSDDARELKRAADGSYHAEQVRAARR